MASDNSSLKIVHCRGSCFIVHLAPEFRQENKFYLMALWSWIPLPFYCHFHREWWPPQTRRPGYSGFVLQLPWDSTWLFPLSGGLVFWAISHLSYYTSALLFATSSHPSPHLEQGFLWHCPMFLFAPYTWLGLVVLTQGHSHALVELQAAASAWIPWLPAQDCSGGPLSPLLWVLLYLTSLHILQHSIIFYCVFSTYY